MMKTEYIKNGGCLQRDSVEQEEYAEAYSANGQEVEEKGGAWSGILIHTISNERLARKGYYDISEAYKSMHLL